MATVAMTGEGKGAVGFWAALRTPYRAGQGVVARRIAYWTAVSFSAWATFDLWQWMQGVEVLRRPFTASLPKVPGLGIDLGWSLPIAGLFLAGLWIFCAWYLNRAWLSDMLIDTEAEMKRVSWPSPPEAWGATKVVAVTVLVITLVLVVFDRVISAVLKLLFNLEI